MQKKGDDVLWYEFKPERCSESLETEDLQIFVEVAQPGRQRDRFNAGSFRALCKGRLYGISSQAVLSSVARQGCRNWLTER